MPGIPCEDLVRLPAVKGMRATRDICHKVILTERYGNLNVDQTTLRRNSQAVPQLIDPLDC
eukprot:393735-Amphidinium_carterae.1